MGNETIQLISEQSLRVLFTNQLNYLKGRDYERN
jgi:hypothetical protein